MPKFKRRSQPIEDIIQARFSHYIPTLIRKNMALYYSLRAFLVIHKLISVIKNTGSDPGKIFRSRYV